MYFFLFCYALKYNLLKKLVFSLPKKRVTQAALDTRNICVCFPLPTPLWITHNSRITASQERKRMNCRRREKEERMSSCKYERKRIEFVKMFPSRKLSGACWPCHNNYTIRMLFRHRIFIVVFPPTKKYYLISCSSYERKISNALFLSRSLPMKLTFYGRCMCVFAIMHSE